MAWPLSSPSEGNCDFFTSPHRVALRHSDRHRRHRSKKSTSRLAPSSTLLSLLATLVSTSTADASPTPPTFLCPSLGSDFSPDLCNYKRAASPVDNENDDDTLIKRSWLPDKYVEGSDGVWRKVESYTLYGATVASNCNAGPCRPPPQTKSAIGDNLTFLPNNNVTHSNASAYDFQLPPGWTPVTKPFQSRTTVILAVTLALSLFICFFILSCLFWRNRKKSPDVEAKARRPGRERLTPEERRRIEEAKALEKFWVRATARWKANARQSFRQRMGRRLINRASRINHSSTSGVDSRSQLAGSSSRPSSGFSVTSSRNQPLGEEHPQSTETTRSLPPPAYHLEHQVPPIVISSSSRPMTPVSESITPHLSLSARPSQLLICPSPQLSPDRELLSQTAHVATDDKALLAQLAELASAPPEVEDFGSAMSHSAPAWNDDLEFESLSPPSAPIGTDDESLPSLFPPPPSKARLAAAERLEYAFAYDDLEYAEPEPEPSAPPFEERSAPLFDESLLLPSAPPLTSHGDNFVIEPPSSFLPSAPAWEALPHSFPQEHLSGQDHDRNAPATSAT